MTQADIALYLGVSKRTLERWVQGRAYPMAWACRELVHRLGVLFAAVEK